MDYKPGFLDNLANNLQAKETKIFDDQPVSFDYWTIKSACATKETGRNFPQVQRIVGGNASDDGAPHSIRNLKHGVIPDEDTIDFGLLQLYNSSKVSDTISAVLPSADGFYLNEKAKKVFSKFHLGEHKYFPLQVEHKKITYDYFWLQLKTDLNEFIDFDRSVFFEKEEFDGPIKEIKITSVNELYFTIDKLFKEWNNKERKYTSVQYKTIILKKDFPKPDLFGFSRLGIDLYISKKIKDAIQNEKLTGFEIQDQRRVLKG